MQIMNENVYGHTLLLILSKGRKLLLWSLFYRKTNSSPCNIVDILNTLYTSRPAGVS